MRKSWSPVSWKKHFWPWSKSTVALITNIVRLVSFSGFSGQWRRYNAIYVETLNRLSRRGPRSIDYLHDALCSYKFYSVLDQSLKLITAWNSKRSRLRSLNFGPLLSYYSVSVVSRHWPMLIPQFVWSQPSVSSCTNIDWVGWAAYGLQHSCQWQRDSGPCFEALCRCQMCHVAVTDITKGRLRF